MASKPCPFCGGEASIEYAAPVGGIPCGFRVSRDNGDCRENIECGTYAFDTEVEAMAAWNHRAGRTCRMIDNGAEPCRPECDCRHPYDDEPEFRMGCGARVVE